MTSPAATGIAQPALSDQLAQLMAQAAGYVGHRTIAIGLRTGLIPALAGAPGATPDQLAASLRLDQLYTAVWCRAALAAAILDRHGEGYRLAPHMATLLLDDTSQAFVGGNFTVLEQPEVFSHFEASLATGQRTWWDQTSPDWITGVAGTGAGFYSRLIPGGLAHVPGLTGQLHAGCRVIDTACGAGTGLVRLASTYPNCQITGVDGDARSIELARARLRQSGMTERVQLVCSALEDMTLDDPATLVINNISMHECRDIDQVTANIKASLKPGGWFVISDFPFPSTDDELRTPAGRIMSGIQFFEAQIGDQLLPRAAYDNLLARHGFTDIGSHPLTPMHALTYGRNPRSP